jgi:hypothetical protein
MQPFARPSRGEPQHGAPMGQDERGAAIASVALRESRSRELPAQRGEPGTSRLRREPALETLQAGGHRFDPGTLHFFDGAKNCRWRRPVKGFPRPFGSTTNITKRPSNRASSFARRLSGVAKRCGRYSHERWERRAPPPRHERRHIQAVRERQQSEPRPARTPPSRAEVPRSFS